MISKFKDNFPMGLSVFYSEEKGEQIVYMKSNKVVKTLVDPKDIKTAKESPDYEELIKFFEEVTKSD